MGTSPPLTVRVCVSVRACVWCEHNYKQCTPPYTPTHHAHTHTHPPERAGIPLAELLANGIAREDLVLDTELENTLPFPSGLSSTDEVLVYVRGGGACVPVSRPGLTPLPLSRLFRRPAFSIASTSSCVNFSKTTSSTFSPPTTWKK